MKVETSDTFFKSLKRLSWHNSGIYRVWETVRYGFPRFFKNVWKFRKSLWEYRWYDYSYSLNFLKDSLKIMSPKFEFDGNEVEINRMKKVAKMKRAIELLERIRGEISYIEMAEKELGTLRMNPIEFKESEDRPGSYELIDNDTPEEKEHNKKIFDRANEIEEEEWKELWEIFKGQDISEFKSGDKEWDEWYDGSGMKHWWD